MTHARSRSQGLANPKSPTLTQMIPAKDITKYLTSPDKKHPINPIQAPRNPGVATPQTRRLQLRRRNRLNEYRAPRTQHDIPFGPAIVPPWGFVGNGAIYNFLRDSPPVAIGQFKSLRVVRSLSAEHELALTQVPDLARRLSNGALSRFGDKEDETTVCPCRLC
ncbi:hypothetical protein BDV28DRAFT_4786 [Aspergillus coremiiformis]|uniref:Uncharacterized protein n=1 Tax=Aspergillus coremiiformis TaxID=138285 RepID=A0A5N6Z876_9EURO|nr:hypothetical protein BDV28DRAFT_4786 [Aspergillus coremiiformis]